MSTRLQSKNKYFCTDKEKLKDFMKAEGFIFKNSILENDDYYLDPKFNLLENNTCIRIRTINNKDVILTFDGYVNNPSGIEMKDKNNVTVDLSQKENIENFLSNIGYYKYVQMNIVKETYVKKDKEYYFSISIDSIENVGEFVDFDIYTDSEDEKTTNNIYYSFEEKIEKVVNQKMNAKYRDFVSAFTYINQLKGDNLKRILVELDKIFIDLNPDSLEDSIKNNLTILNLELIEELESKGIMVQIVYSNTDEPMINALKKILDRVGYTPTFMNIRAIKELSVKETFILEKQKKISFNEVAFMILTNRIEKQ